MCHNTTLAHYRLQSVTKCVTKPGGEPEVRQIKGRLEDLYAAVLEGRAERAAAAVANQIANTQLRAIEVERRIREQDELEQRLDEMEEMLEQAESRSTTTYVRRR